MRVYTSKTTKHDPSCYAPSSYFCNTEFAAETYVANLVRVAALKRERYVGVTVLTTPKAYQGAQVFIEVCPELGSIRSRIVRASRTHFVDILNADNSSASAHVACHSNKDCTEQKTSYSSAKVLVGIVLRTIQKQTEWVTTKLSVMELLHNVLTGVSTGHNRRARNSWCGMSMRALSEENATAFCDAVRHYTLRKTPIAIMYGCELGVHVTEFSLVEFAVDLRARHTLASVLDKKNLFVLGLVSDNSYEQKTVIADADFHCEAIIHRHGNVEATWTSTSSKIPVQMLRQLENTPKVISYRKLLEQLAQQSFTLRNKMRFAGSDELNVAAVLSGWTTSHCIQVPSNHLSVIQANIVITDLPKDEQVPGMIDINDTQLFDLT